MTERRGDPLISVIRERVIETLGSRVAGECLMALAERGVYTHRELLTVAKAVAGRYPDMDEIIDFTVGSFASSASLPRSADEREAMETIAGGGLRDEHDEYERRSQ